MALDPYTPYTEPVEGDTLTKYIRSAQNNLTQQGGNQYQTGQSVFGQGMQMFAPSMAAGMQTYNQGVQGLAPTLQYLTQLTRGDQGDVSQAIQPEANRIRDSFAAVRNMISSQPRGGGKAGLLAESPYEEQKKIADTAAAARQGASGELGKLSSTLAGLGLSQAELGSQTAKNIAGLGLTQAELGFQTQEAADKAALARRGQNLEQSGMKSFVEFSQALNNLI